MQPFCAWRRTTPDQAHERRSAEHNRVWFEPTQVESTLAFERELGVVHTAVDAPQGFANSVPQVWAVTHPQFAYVRLHGRNADTWNTKGATAASDRFDDDYPADEIAAIADRTRQLTVGVPNVHVVFNNNQEDQGQRNARALIERLAIGSGRRDSDGDADLFGIERRA